MVLRVILERRERRQSPARRAVQWIKRHRLPGRGIAVHHRRRVATQEVTGYTIPTLYAWGEKELAKSLARWEASVQRPDGSFVAVDNVPYTFDTAQVARGFLAVLEEVPELEPNLRKACDYVVSQIGEDGEVHTPSYDTWKTRDGDMLSEYGNLYVLPPLLNAGLRLGEPRYVAAARRALGYFAQKEDLVEFKSSFSTISHYFGYMMEALVDMGEVNLAREGLGQVLAIQRADGAIPAYPGVDWVCTPGIAQLAVALFKLGDIEPANRALAYLEQLQNPSGGFYGSYGPGARYFADSEIAWAAKFFLDCYLVRPAGALGAP